MRFVCPVCGNRWETRVPGEVTTREYINSDGTFTVQSDYILVPSRETHRETLTCVTTYNEEVYTDSVTLDIQCKSFVRSTKYNRCSVLLQYNSLKLRQFESKLTLYDSRRLD